MGARRSMTRASVAILLSASTVGGLLIGPSAAAQQPPGAPGDELTAAEAELQAAQRKLADTYEAFTAADQRHQTAGAAAQAAESAAARARSEADAATNRERELQREVDTIAAASYRQGVGSVSVKAYINATDPTDLLDRASLLNMIAGDYTEVMAETRQAIEQKARADHEARVALDQAVRDRDAADAARADAERAYRAAVDEQDEAQAETQRLAQRRASLAARDAPAAPATRDAPAAPATRDAPAAPATRDASAAPASGDVVLPAQGRLTSTYGARWGTIHYGIDIANSIGTPILAAMAGVVIDSGPASGFGLWVRVQHGNGLITVYGHINESLVRVGQQVAAGEQIATLGNRGQSTGPHLHFEVHQNGSKIDPLPWLRSRGVNI